MTSTEIINYYKEINKFLLEKNICSAFSTLEMLINKLGFLNYNTQLKELIETYKYVLHYFIENVPDPKRNDIVHNIISRLQLLNNRINYEALLSVSSEDYFINAREQKEHSLSLTNLLREYDEIRNKVKIANESEFPADSFQRKLQELCYSIFRFSWTTQFLSKEETDILSKILSDSSTEDDEKNHRALLQSAIIVGLYLGATRYYDDAKFKLLITTILNNRNVQVLARAYVLLIMLLAQYKSLVEKDKKIISLLSLACDNDYFNQIYMSVIEFYARSIDTERINKTLQNDIIPNFIKMRPDLEEALNEMKQSDDFEETDYQEKWEDIMNRYGLEDKMRKLNDMQLEGADMFMTAFAKQKQTPFFYNPANWLLPFDPSNSEVSQIVDRLPEKFISIVNKSPMFCDSDLYSLFFGLKMMPSNYINNVCHQLSDQLNMVNEDILKAIGGDSQQTLIVAINKFMKDLYRFYNQYYRAREYQSTNPFKQRIDFTKLPITGDFIDNKENLISLGNLFFKNKMWKECVNIFSEAESFFPEQMKVISTEKSDGFPLHYDFIDLNNPDDKEVASLLEKKGIALMQQGLYDEAKKSFLNSMIFNNKSSWLLSKLAECFYRTNDLKYYYKYLKMALELEPDNRKLLLRMAHFLIDCRKYEEASKILYKLIYTAPDNILYMRTLAWCQCLLGQPEKAIDNYNSIPRESLIESDYINMGHCFFALKNYPEARDCYMSFLKKKGVEAFLKALKEDVNLLSILSDSKENLNLLKESVLYKYYDLQM